MGKIRKNLKYDSLPHNRGYSQSKTSNLAPKHHANHNRRPKLMKHDKTMKLRQNRIKGKKRH